MIISYVISLCAFYSKLLLILSFYSKKQLYSCTYRLKVNLFLWMTYLKICRKISHASYIVFDNYCSKKICIEWRLFFCLLREKYLHSELFWSALSKFGLNTERYSVSRRIQYKCGKIRTRITPNMDTFYVVVSFMFPE